MANTKVPAELSSTPGIIDNSTATALTIDSAGAATFSGNVGIGRAASSVVRLAVAGVDAGSSNYAFEATNSSLATKFIVRNDGQSQFFKSDNSPSMTLDASGNLTLNTANSTLNVGNGGFSQTNYGLLGLNGASGGFIKMGTAGVEQGAVYANSGGLTFQTPATYAMTWYPAGAFGMKLDTSGNLLVGVNSVDSAIRGIEVKGSANKYVGMFRNTTDGYGIIFRSAANTSVGTIVWSASATAYNTSSDYRLKEDAVPMTGATERVKALRPINFAWKVDGSRTDGFLAHEAQEVVPEAVHGTKDAMRDEEYEVTPAVEEVRDEDGNIITEAVAAVMGTRSVPDYQGIDQSKLVPLLTATIQELIARIEALEGE